MSQSRQSIASRRVRRLALAACLASAGGCTSGGASLASLNPFTKPETTITTTPTQSPGVAESVSGLAHNTRSQADSMGMAVKSAYAKGRDSVMNLFGSETVTETEDGQRVAATDPLSLENKPTSVGAEVFVANGQLWESTGNFERAMDNYSKALEKDPANGAALASIARLNYRQGRYDTAVDYFQRALKATPNEAGLYNDLGLTFSKLERHDEAATALKQALAIAPTTTRYANNLATVQFHAGREDEARATLARHNQPAVAHYNMAYLLHTANRNDQALQELAQVLAMGEPAEGDSASQRAIERSRELFDKLGGPTSQIAKSLPHLIGEASKVVEQVRNTGTGVSAQLSDGVVPAGAISERAPAAAPATLPAQPAPQASTPAARTAQAPAAQPAATAPAASAPSAAPLFTNPLAPQPAPKPTTAPTSTPTSAPAPTEPAPAAPSPAFSLPPGIE